MTSLTNKYIKVYLETLTDNIPKEEHMYNINLVSIHYQQNMEYLEGTMETLGGDI